MFIDKEVAAVLYYVDFGNFEWTEPFILTQL
jgi:hypothetical protein